MISLKRVVHFVCVVSSKILRAKYMKIVVNDEKIAVPDAATLADMLSTLEMKDCKGIAVAVNENVVPQGEWCSYALSENDVVLLITAAQGG